MSKNKWKTVDLSLQFSIKSDWSKDEVDTPLSDVNSIRSCLPTKTNATRQFAELDNISENGPFILNFANAPFEATESDLKSFFRSFEVINIELNGSRRGCGHISFTNRNDLSGAWQLNEKMFLSRPIRLSIPLKEDIARQQAMGSKSRYNSQQPSMMSTDDGSCWRVKKPQVNSNSESLGTETNWRSQNLKSNENSTETNKIEETNWRTKSREVTSPSTNIDIDNTDWRSRAPRETKTETSSWRTQERSNIADSCKTTGITSMDNTEWRSRAPRETKPEASAWRTQGKPNIESNLKTTETDSNWRARTAKTELSTNVNCDFKETKTGENWRKTRTEGEEMTKKNSNEHTKFSTDSIPQKPNAWTSKRPTGTLISNAAVNNDQSNPLEWRIKRTTPSRCRSRVTSDNNSVTLSDSLQQTLDKDVKKPAQPAPLPTVNVWEERKKLRANANKGIIAGEGVSKEIFSENKAEAEGMPAVVDKGAEEGNKTTDVVAPDGRETIVSGDSSINNNNVAVVEQLTTKQGSRVDHHGRLQVSRPPVIISVNGPYLDPKSHRIPLLQQHSSTSDNISIPTAIPVTKFNGSTNTTSAVLTSRDTVPKSPSDSKPCSGDLKLTNSQSSWSKGPPKGLLGKKSCPTSAT